jgi:hypothetical protein
MPTFDWMHALALVAGAFATALWARTSPAAAAPTGTSTPKTPSSAAIPTTGSPLFDALLKVLEGKLSDLIAVEPGPDGSPMFTIRVVLAPESTTPATPTQPTTPAK